MANVARLVANDVNGVVLMPADYEADGVTMNDCQQDPLLTLCGVNESPSATLAAALNDGDLIATAVCAARLGDEAVAALGNAIKRRGLGLGYIVDEQALAIFNDSIARIHSIALVHERLYQSKNFRHFDLASYLEGLVKELVRPTSRNERKRTGYS